MHVWASGSAFRSINRRHQQLPPGPAGGRYTAQVGETLAGIAQSVWGDSSLWYKIAEANGLSGDAQLVEGQQLTLPIQNRLAMAHPW